jgi:hypothetical protein
MDNVDLDDPEEYQPRRGPYPLQPEERLEAGTGPYSPEEVALAGRKKLDKDTPAATVETIDRQIKRAGMRFHVGETEEAEYRTDLERLRRQRAVYASQAESEPTRANSPP